MNPASKITQLAKVEIPCSPDLVRILRDHIEQFGTDGEGRLFRGQRGGQLATVTYRRLWQRAREVALGKAEAATSPLARRPYDLRHAAVSTWLKSSNDPAQVAEWAGHSIAVLHQVYAKVLDGGEADTLRKIEAVLNPPQPKDHHRRQPQSGRRPRHPGRS